MAKTQVTTRRVNEFWFQKTKRSADGKSIFSYHYLRKNEKRSKAIIWDTPKAKRLLAYQAIYTDLLSTLTIIQEYRVLATETAKLSGIEAQGKKIALKALMTFIVVTYAKCFNSGDGRASILNKSLALKNSKYISQHNAFIDMRNKYCAHAGKPNFEESRLVIPIPPLKQMRKEKRFLFSPVGELVQTVVEKSFANDYEPLVLEVLQHVNKKIDELYAAVMKEFYDLGQEMVEKLILRCGSNQYITYRAKPGAKNNDKRRSI